MSAVAVSAEEVTLTVDPNSGSLNSPSGYSNTYTGSAENSITILSKRGTTDNLAANMKFVNSNLNIYSGNPAPATYYITAKNPDWYVSEFSFDAKALSGSQTITVLSKTAVSLSTTSTQHFTSDAIGETTQAKFVLAGSNTGTELTNFTVKLRPRSLPHESGWYTIQATHIGTKDVSYHVACTNEEYRQSATNFYPLKFVTTIPEGMPATQFVRLDMVDATHVHVYSSNGHGVNQNCTSAKDTPNNTAVVVASPEQGTVKIGGYWNEFNPTDAAATEKPYIGQGSSAGSNTFKMAKAKPEETYDLWTVTITGDEVAVAEVKDNARIVLTREENKGLKKVYNHGIFFVTKGTTLAATDFTAEQYASNLYPVFTVDNEAKTITADFSMTQSSKSKCLELAHHKIDELYAPYAAQCFYADGIVEKAIEAAKAKITAAAGDGSDDAAVSDEIFKAVASATEAASTTLATDVTEFNKSAVGRLIHLNNDRQGSYSRRLTVNANGQAVTLPKDNALNEIWVIASSDDAGHLSLQNYYTGKYINSANNNSATWTTVDAPNATNGYFTVTPRLKGTKYPVDFHDQGSNNRYMHAKDDHNVIGWESNATTAGSAWLITLAEAEEVADAIESEPSYVDTHKVSFTHPEGLMLRSDITYLPCHNIIITKVDTSAEAEEPLSRAVADAAFEPITIAPTSLTACENGFTADLGTKLDEGFYEVKVPAAIFLVGSDATTAKLSKSYDSSFSVSSDGTTTGIGETAAPVPAVNIIYDLQGRRLAAPAKGINIINGRKVLIR